MTCNIVRVETVAVLSDGRLGFVVFANIELRGPAVPGKIVTTDHGCGVLALRLSVDLCWVVRYVSRSVCGDW
jgi:hypothetical protein